MLLPTRDMSYRTGYYVIPSLIGKVTKNTGRSWFNVSSSLDEAVISISQPKTVPSVSIAVPSDLVARFYVGPLAGI
jgi:hypothetical protein